LSRTALMIANPTAGFGPSGLAETAARTLESLGLRTELYLTQRSRDAERAAREAAASFDLVIAAGGDGTVHEVANGIAGSRAALGIVPLGTMNIVARELGMPLNVRGACTWITRARPAPVALGWRGPRAFLIVAGFGYDAFCLEDALERSRALGRKVRIPDYARTALLRSHLYPFPPIEASFEGETVRCAFGFVANCARYGGNLRIAREARMEEPRLDLVLFESGRMRDRVRYFLSVLAGRQRATRGVVYRKVTSVELRPVPEGVRVPCELDGETSEPLPASFRVTGDALLLLRDGGGARR
jgi:diacylglycerol kinase family enzyme